MRAWLMDSYDGVEKLRLSDVEEGQPGPGEALVAIRFAALNPADAFLSIGQYPARPKLPHILGRDGVGTVLAVGPNVQTAYVGADGWHPAVRRGRNGLGNAGRENRGSGRQPGSRSTRLERGRDGGRAPRVPHVVASP
jgi:NADPH:quinone reductase-like Zn-dependent oxidoreductase